MKRPVTVDIYLPPLQRAEKLSLLLIHDGQNLEEFHFARMLAERSGRMQPLLCVGIHAGPDRKMEYGTAGVRDYLGRGALAAAHQQFVTSELLPWLHQAYQIDHFEKQAVAGFSLGGLSALDMVWHYPQLFSIAGVFSGSLWWRSKSLEDGYNEATDRIMHQLIREGMAHKNLRFYFTTGSLDETADRNGNGIIDSIDDTIALVDALKEKGYGDEDIYYINYEDGRHDIITWGRALPHFLLWAFGKD